MTTYSFSQISTYLQCPRKYQFHYLDRLPTKEFETSYELILGSLVHLSLDRRYQQMFPKEESLFTTSHIPSKSDLLEFFNHHREKEVKETSNIRTPEDFTPQEIKIRAEKYLSDYYDKHHSDFLSPGKERMTDDEAEQRNPLSRGSTDRAGSLSVETEKEMLFTLPNGQSFKGILDRIDFLPDGTIIINDYKTGKRLPTASDTGYVDQLSLYAYAIKQQYPQAKTIKARIIYLHFGIEDEREIQDDALHTLVQTYQTYTSELESKRQTYFQTKSPLPVQENSFCKYCEYQSSCPLWKHSFLTPETMSAEDSRHLPSIDQFATVSKQLSEQKRQLEYHKKLIKEYMLAQNMNEFLCEETMLKLSSRKGIDIPNLDLLQTFLHSNHLRDQASSVTRFKVGALIKGQVLDPDVC